MLRLLVTRLLSTALVAAMVVGGASMFAPAQAAPTVDVHIDIIKGSRDTKGFQGGAKVFKKVLSEMGFVGAKTIDTVTATKRSVGSTIELRFRDPGAGNAERSIIVKVLEASKKRTRFHVQIPTYRFSTQTTHKDGGALITGIPKHGLFLAVRPGS